MARSQLKVEDNPNALKELYAEVDRVLAAMAEAGADQLSDNLSAGSRSGVFYPSNPRRSSASGEFSQEQTGQLKGMVGSGQLAPLSHYFGLEPGNSDETKQAKAQEFGAPSNNLTGRANVTRTSLDSKTHRRMVTAGSRAT